MLNTIRNFVVPQKNVNLKQNKGPNFKGLQHTLPKDVLEITGSQTKAKVFARYVEPEAMAQIKEICNMPIFQNARIRIMPDVSACKNCVVGFTAKVTPETIKKLPPFIIGNDIGCGVLLVKTNAKVGDIDLAELDNFIRHELPNNKRLRPEMSSELTQNIITACELYGKDKNRIFDQAGTLGNGNHFIELNTDKENNLYLSIHTGSRQFGSYVKEYFEKLYNEGVNNPNMTYAEAVAMAQQYAQFNRESIAKMILEKFKLKSEMQFDCPHNYISADGTVHKGSIDASEGKPVLIPLNMRDGIVLGTGKGNEDWNCSAPHGAGRKLSRSEARQRLDLHEYTTSMSGIFSNSVGRKTIDEAPQAYKDSETTLDLIKDTVNIETVIRPIYNYKNT